MFRLFLTPLFFFLICFSISAQTLSIFDVDASNFPTVKAKFYAFDVNGKQITNLSESDFTVKENGEERTVTNVSCPAFKPPEAISSVLTIDVSGSMRGSGINYAKAAARAWVNTLPLGMSECAISSFNTSNNIVQDFTTKKDRLLNAIDRLGADGGTDFDAGFIEQKSGALLVADSGKYKKVIVFLTDGHANGNENAIVQKANSIGGIIYCVVIDENAPSILKNVAARTGGQWFDNIRTQEEAEEVYKKILMMAQGGETCELEWESETSCTPEVKVNIELINYSLSNNIYYLIPYDKLARLDVSPMSIWFKNIKPGSTKDTTITVTAINSDFNITNIISSNPLFDISPKSFSLTQGQSKNLTVTFSPIEESYEYGIFDFQMDRCDAKAYLSGSYYGASPKTPTIKITHPNGGEKLLAGSDTVITWEGVLPTDTVSLDYSIDNGNTWKEITKAALNLKHNWKVPNTPSYQCLMKINQRNDNSKLKVINLSGHTSRVYHDSFSPDGTRIVTASGDSTAKIWDANTGALIHTLTGHTNRVLHAEFSPDGSRIVTASEDNTAKIWDANTGALIHTLTGHIYIVNHAEFNTDGSRIVTASTDNTAKIWDANTGALIHTLTGHIYIVVHAEFNTDGSRIVTTSYALTPKIWDANTGALIHTLTGHNGSVFHAEFSPDGSRIVTASYDNKAKVWDAVTGALIHTLEGHTGFVYHAEFSPDGSRIVTASRDSTAKIWDTESGNLIHTLTGHTSGVHHAEFSPDGSRIVTASFDQKAKIWFLNYRISQADTSDALWSIVKPEATSIDIDMGPVIVGELKDSLITGFLTNTCTYPIRIDSIYFVGANPNQFDIVKGIPPYTIPDSGQKAVEFRFKPNLVGNKSATIVIITQADTLEQTITGEGVDKQLEITTKIVDFGRVEVNDSKNVSEFVIENISNTAIDITSTDFIIPEASQFTIISPGQFTLQPGDTREMEFQFNPTMIGRTSRDVGFYYDGVGSPAKVQLYGEGIGGFVYVQNDSAYQSDKVVLKLKIGGVKVSSLQNIASKFRAQIRMQKSILALNEVFGNFSSALSNDSTIIEFTGALSGSTDELIEIPMIAGLGNVKETSIDIEEFEWLDDNGAVVDYDTEFQSGIFKLLGICPEGGDRLLNPDGEVQLMSIIPNPANETVEIELELIENGNTQLFISNMLGERIQTLMDGNPELGRQTLSFSTRGLPSGTYFVILRTPTVVKTQRMEVVK